MNINSLMKKSSIIIACSLAACNHDVKKEETKLNTGVELANFDTTMSPRQDFYQYVNGNWLKNNPIPASESSWGSFNELNEKSIKDMKAIALEAANTKDAAAGSNIQKIGDFYSTGIDSVKLNQEGASPLKDEFTAIDNVKTQADLINLIAHFHYLGIGPLFGNYVNQDAKMSTQNILYVSQGGIGLPDMDYYLNPNEQSKNIRLEYLKHVQKMFELIGDKPEAASKESKLVMDIETKLSEGSMTRVERRDVEANYNKKTIEEMAKLVPAIDWKSYLKIIGAPAETKDLIVEQPKFFVKVNSLLKTVSVEDWKTYLRWHLINGTANMLSDDFINEHFNFYGKTLSGAKEIKPRWKRCLETIDRSMGEALGKLYVEKHFGEESKKRVNEMVDNLTAAYKDRINSRDWMSPETKKQALVKLSSFMRKLGYPDNWRDYSSLEIKNDSYVQNVLRANAFESKRSIEKIGKPVDRTEWAMSPPTINAYYNPSLNEIVFPAGIMQAPFFNVDADDAVNYGSMGAIIGHELSHGFDDQGSQYDADGNIKNWWTAQDKENFKAKTAMIIKQFNSFVAIDSMHVNGELTLGENIADLGGLTIGYYALKKSLEGKAEPAKIDGFTAEQRFFISWAQGWRGNRRPESLKQLIITNPHSPGNFRVLGPLSNMPEFYAAFGVKEGDAMFRPAVERAEVW